MPTIHTEDHPAGLALVPLAPGASAIPVLKGLLHAAMGGSVGGHYDDMRRALASEADSNADLCAEAEIARDEWRALALDLAARFGVAPGETAHGPANIRAALGLLVPVSMVGPAMGDHGDAVADLDGADTGIDCLPTTEAIPADDASPVGALAEEVFPHLTQALELAHELACARGWSEDCPETAGMPIPQMIALLLALIYHIAKSPPVQTVAKAGAAVLQSDDEPAAEVAEPPEELPPAAEVIPAVDAAAEIPAEPAAVADSDPADTEEVTPAPSVSAPELPERLIGTSAEPEALTGALAEVADLIEEIDEAWDGATPEQRAEMTAEVERVNREALIQMAEELEGDPDADAAALPDLLDIAPERLDSLPQDDFAPVAPEDLDKEGLDEEPQVEEEPPPAWEISKISPGFLFTRNGTLYRVEQVITEDQPDDDPLLIAVPETGKRILLKGGLQILHAAAPLRPVPLPDGAAVWAGLMSVPKAELSDTIRSLTPSWWRAALEHRGVSLAANPLGWQGQLIATATDARSLWGKFKSGLGMSGGAA